MARRRTVSPITTCPAYGSTAEYGSDQYHERPLEVVSASLSDDRKTITLRIPEIEPTWCMEIKYWLKAADGKDVEGLIQNTIHHLAD